MKKICIFFLTLFILGITVLGFFLAETEKNDGLYTAQQNYALSERDFLRIHIRADSNESGAQAVKYRVRDSVIEYLAPVLAYCEDREEAMQEIQARLPQIAQGARDVLRAQGFVYGARATLEKESFPTRVYAEYTLPSGEYTALMIRLGKGAGDNWWCVVYPPLCFTGSGSGYIYSCDKCKESYYPHNGYFRCIMWCDRYVACCR